MATFSERLDLRVDRETKRRIAQLRIAGHDPEKIPTASEIIREAVREKFERDVKPNGHKHRNGK